MGLVSQDRQAVIRCILLFVVLLLAVSCVTKTIPGSPQQLEPENVPPTLPTRLMADFVATPTRGPVPLTVTFNDQSQGEIKQWSWEFGDGVFGDSKQPVHTYTSVGTYTVSLTVVGASGSDSKIRYDYIEVTPEVISWEAAVNYIGQTKVVEGTVVSGKYVATSKGKPTFLNIGKPYPEPGRFTVLIWGTNRSEFEVAFPPNPETYFLDKKVQVKGKIEEYMGNAEIIIYEPSQIRIVK